MTRICSASGFTVPDVFGNCIRVLQTESVWQCIANAKAIVVLMERRLLQQQPQGREFAQCGTIRMDGKSAIWAVPAAILRYYMEK